MATGLDMKPRATSREIDENDPLAELTRIMGFGRQEPEAARPDPQISLEDNFSLDLERELAFEDEAAPLTDELDMEFSETLEDELSGAMQFGESAPSLEPPSLEDELSALLGGEDVAPVKPAVAAARFEAPAWQPAPAVLPVGASYQDETSAWEPALTASPAETGYQDEMPAEDADLSFADEDFELAAEPQVAAVAGADYDDGEPDFDFAELDTAVEAEPDYKAAYEPEMRLAADDYAVAGVPDDGVVHDIEDDYAGEEMAADGDIPPAPEFAGWDHATVEPAEPSLDRLVAVTAPEPIVEARIPDAEMVEATDDFDVPDFEFDPEPVQSASADDTVSGFDEPYPAYHREAAAAPVARTVADDIDFDFDAVLGKDLEDEIAGLAAGGAAAAAASTSMRPRPVEQVNADLDFEALPDESTGIPDDPYLQPAARRRSWLAPALLAGVVILGGGAFYAFSGKSATTGANGVALVKADADPVKVAPENPGGKTVPDQDKAVYDKVAGADQATPTQTQLISESEEPVDIASATPASPESADGSAKSEARVDPAVEGDNANAVSPETAAVAPKKVRTFIVKPDGTLVERPADAAPAAAAAAPQDEPASALAPVVADKPAALAPVAEPAAAEAKIPAAPAEDPVAQLAAAEPAAAEPAKAEAPVAEQPVAETPAAAAKPAAKTADPAIKVVKTKKIKAPAAETAAAAPGAPVLEERPADQPVNIVGKTGKQPAAETQVAAAAAAPAEAAPAAAPGGYAIQIASTPSPEAAKSTYAALNRKFLSVIGGRGVNIQKAEVDGKGTVYRVRIPAGSKQDAAALCQQYKASGGSCFVTR